MTEPAASYDFLPTVLREIAEIAGLEAALKVAEAVGGTRAYIPRRPAPDHWLLRAVGPEASALIVEHFTTGRSGAEIEFPVGPGGSYNRERRHRARRLAELTAQGLSTGSIARQVGITRRGVQMFNARQAERGDSDQGDLDL